MIIEVLMLSTITPAGITAEHQQYLYEKIRALCSSEEAAELICPRPAPQLVIPPPKRKTSTRLCSRKPGHVHKKKNWKVLLPRATEVTM